MERKRPILEIKAKEWQKIRKGNQPGATPLNLAELGEPGEVRNQLAKELGVSDNKKSQLDCRFKLALCKERYLQESSTLT